VKRRIIDRWLPRGGWKEEPCADRAKVFGFLSEQGRRSLHESQNAAGLGSVANAVHPLFHITILPVEEQAQPTIISRPRSDRREVGATGRELITASRLLMKCMPVSATRQAWRAAGSRYYGAFSTALACDEVMELDPKKRGNGKPRRSCGAAMRQSRVGELSHWKGGRSRARATRIFRRLLALATGCRSSEANGIETVGVTGNVAEICGALQRTVDGRIMICASSSSGRPIYSRRD